MFDPSGCRSWRLGECASPRLCHGTFFPWFTKVWIPPRPASGPHDRQRRTNAAPVQVIDGTQCGGRQARASGTNQSSLSACCMATDVACGIQRTSVQGHCETAVFRRTSLRVDGSMRVRPMLRPLTCTLLTCTGMSLNLTTDSPLLLNRSVAQWRNHPFVNTLWDNGGLSGQDLPPGFGPVILGVHKLCIKLNKVRLAPPYVGQASRSAVFGGAAGLCQGA